jgi:hypothetical protein
MVYASAVVLTVLNLGFWVDMLFNLPGTCAWSWSPPC